MPRKPNYRFEKNERERLKALKKAKRSQRQAEPSVEVEKDAPPQVETGDKPD